MEEIWKDISGFEGHYQVSNLGNVRSLVGWNGHKTVERKKVLKPSMTTTGYWKVKLVKDGARKDYRIHRLVALSFLEKEDGKDVVNHKDGNKLNNDVQNLEWCTQKENIDHAVEFGLRKKCSNSQREVILDKYVTNGKRVKDIASELCLTPTQVRNQVRRGGISLSHNRRKYCLPLETIKKELENGAKPRELAAKYNCPSNLISVQKYKWKVEVLANGK